MIEHQAFVAHLRRDLEYHQERASWISDVLTRIEAMDAEQYAQVEDTLAYGAELFGRWRDAPPEQCKAIGAAYDQRRVSAEQRLQQMLQDWPLEVIDRAMDAYENLL